MARRCLCAHLQVFVHILCQGYHFLGFITVPHFRVPAVLIMEGIQSTKGNVQLLGAVKESKVWGDHHAALSAVGDNGVLARLSQGHKLAHSGHLSLGCKAAIDVSAVARGILNLEAVCLASSRRGSNKQEEYA